MYVIASLPRRLLAVLLVSLFCLIACNLPQEPQSRSGTLSVTLPERGGRMAFDDYVDTLEFYLNGKGPASFTEQELNLGQNKFTVIPGAWTFTLSVRNKEGKDVGGDSKTVLVEAGKISHVSFLITLENPYPETYLLTFNVNAGDTGAPPLTMNVPWKEANKTPALRSLGLSLPEPPPLKGYNFEGWRVGVEGGEPFTVDTPVIGDLTLYAYWSSIAVVAEITASPAAGNYTTSQSVTLRSGTEGAVIRYTLDGSMPSVASDAYTGPITISETATIKAIAVKSGMADSEVLTAGYTIMPIDQVIMPLPNPTAGNYAETQRVTLRSATEGAVIYYTLDGSTPSVTNDTYIGPITISETATLKAIAVKSGMLNSEVLTAEYTITPPSQVVIPQANPPGGNYNGTQSVTLTSVTEGAAIYYTLDGSTPTPGSLAYSGPITISETATLKVIAIKSGMIDSGILIAAYVITTYEVGDTGPAGGIVFYDKGTYSDGWRYMEAAPVETEKNVSWGADGYNITGTQESIGAGAANTTLIVDYLNIFGGTGTAAQICDELAFSGYNDWFLPSKEELNLMFTELKKVGLGDFRDDWYWSSSPHTNELERAWLQNFSDGSQDRMYKYFSFAVRAVRAF